MNGIAKYVVSSTLSDSDLTWDNSTLIPGDEAVAGIRELHDTDGGDLVVMGSPTLARTLLQEGLADELRLIVMPVLLGGGKRIFPDDGAQQTLELVSAVTSDAGVQVCIYRPAGGVAGAAHAQGSWSQVRRLLPPGPLEPRVGLARPGVVSFAALAP